MCCFSYEHQNVLQQNFNKNFATKKMKICKWNEKNQFSVYGDETCRKTNIPFVYVFYAIYEKGAIKPYPD